MCRQCAHPREQLAIVVPSIKPCGGSTRTLVNRGRKRARKAFSPLQIRLRWGHPPNRREKSKHAESVSREKPTICRLPAPAVLMQPTCYSTTYALMNMLPLHEACRHRWLVETATESADSRGPNDGCTAADRFERDREKKGSRTPYNTPDERCSASNKVRLPTDSELPLEGELGRRDGGP